MADGLNKVLLLGNLGAEPELRITQGGTAILRLRVATSESYLDRNNVRQERTEWHSITIWGRRGEALAKILKKGERVFIEGSLRTTSYEKNGEKRYSTEINAANIILAGSASSGARREDGMGGEARHRPSAAPTGDDARDWVGEPNGGGDDGMPF